MMNSLAAESDGSDRATSLFDVFVWTVQFFFGGWLFFNGLNYFVEFTPAPPSSSPLARELITALEHTGLFAWVKAVELLTGLALLANRMVPLATVIAFPVSFAIAYVMLVINGGVVGTIVGVLVIAFNGFIALSRLDAFLPLFGASVGGQKVGRYPIAGARARSPLARLTCIVLGIAAPVGIELATMAHFQSAARNSMTQGEADPRTASEPR